MNEYEGMRRVQYIDGATFVPVCIKCGRFVKANIIYEMTKGKPSAPNAKCKKCGDTYMLFEGYYELKGKEADGERD